MKKLISIIFILLPGLCLLSSCDQPHPGDRKIKIIIDYFDAVNTPKYNVELFADLLADKMQKTGSYTIIDCSKLSEMLREIQLQESGITDDAGKLKAGRLLGAEKLISGTVLKKNNTVYITIRAINLVTGEIDYTEVFKITPNVDVAKLIEKNLRRLGIMEGRRIRHMRGRA